MIESHPTSGPDSHAVPDKPIRLGEALAALARQAGLTDDELGSGRATERPRGR
jgi:hypothetical protein